MAWISILSLFLIKYVCASENTYVNSTAPIYARQLLQFKLEHPKPIGLYTYEAGAPVEIRDTVSINSDVYGDNYFLEVQGHHDAERIPERAVQAKGVGVWGYFEVTNDVSKYTKADVFNGVGKKTQVFVRFSASPPENGGPDTNRDLKGMAVKFYTKHGILDLLSLQIPVFPTKDPNDFFAIVHAFARRNPKTHLIDFNQLVDITVLRPDALTTILFLLSDHAIPNGWQHSDFFPLHTFELVNEHGDRWYVRFSWRTLQGRQFLTTAQTLLIPDNDYYIRTLYTAVANNSMPSWQLEMDVLSLKEIQTVDYDPFDVTRRWKNGTYVTVPIGKLVLKDFADNQFRDAEQSVHNPTSLVPGIPGPVDNLLRGRRFSYRDVHNYRVKRNHLNIGVNSPYYQKSYRRDGDPPVGDNGDDSPNYYPNSFNGPIPYVDEDRPREELLLLETNAVDLQEANDFYNKWLPDEGARLRLVENIGVVASQIVEELRKKFVVLLGYVDPDLQLRVILAALALNITTGCEEKLANLTLLNLPKNANASGPIPNFPFAPPNFPGPLLNFTCTPPNFPAPLPNIPGPLPNFPCTPPNFPAPLPNIPGPLPNVPAPLPNVPAPLPNLPSSHPNIPAPLPNVPAPLPNVPASQPNVPAPLPNVPGPLPNLPASQPNLPAPASNPPAGVSGPLPDAPVAS